MRLCEVIQAISAPPQAHINIAVASRISRIELRPWVTSAEGSWMRRDQCREPLSAGAINKEPHPTRNLNEAVPARFAEHRTCQGVAHHEEMIDL